jgi:hypothetical protein
MPPKRVRSKRPYEKIGDFLQYYEKKCVIYDVPLLDLIKEIYEPLMVKKARRFPQLLQFADFDVDAIHLRPLLDSFQETEIHIRFLSMLNTETGDDGLHVIAHALLPPLELAGLAYHGNKVGPSGCRAIARGMIQSKFLAVLELDFNPGVSDEGVRSLCHYGHCQSMTKLSLRFCDVGDSGAAALGNWIARDDCVVREILLNGNKICPVGATAIGHGLRANKSIVRLDLGDNLFGYDADCLDAIHDGIIECPTFQCINMMNHFVCPEGMAEKYFQLTRAKPLGECVLTVKMDSIIFQNTRQLAMQNKRKMARDTKRKRAAARKAAELEKAAAAQQSPAPAAAPNTPRRVKTQ